MTPEPQAPPSAAGARINPVLPYILFGAFIFSCFVYGGLIASGLLREAIGPVLSDLPVPLPVIFGALAIMNVPLAILIGNTVRLDGLGDPNELFRGIVRKLILQSAFFEAIAIYGLVGYILGMEAVPAMVFVGFAFACLVALVPGLQNQMDRLRSLLRESAS